MTPIRLIARDEIRLMRRNRVAMIAFALLVLLTLAAVVTSWSHQRALTDLRARHQQAAEQAFDAQPNRHPHRVVHYGHFIFRPLSPLAAFDPGVDPFTGSSMFLEGHRQNSANFGDVRQSSILVRFGQLTPAFVLQSLVPLLLIFVGYGAIARERERGTLRPLMLQGASRAQIIMGKLGALALVALCAALPALLGFALIAGQPGALAGPMAMIAIGYLAYLALWVILTVTASAMAKRSRDALLGLLAIWAVTIILMPRFAPDIASAAYPLENRLQTDIAIARDLRTMGDSHDPNDPHFARFKQSVLNRYGVARVEDLPVNYKGLLGMEGERLTSALFDRYTGKSNATQHSQNTLVRSFGLLSPTISLRALSMAAAGTDFAAHQRFLEQAEAYRYALVQRLNRLQAEGVDYHDDTADDADADRRKRVDASHWEAMPDFRFKAADASTLTQAALPGLMMILGWLAAATGLLIFSTRRLGDAR